MVNRQIDAMGELQNAFNVLFKNWVLAVPPALVSLVAGLFFVFVIAGITASILAAGAMGARPSLGALLGGGGVTLFLGAIVIALLSVLAQAIVIAGAERVWHGQPADLASGISKAMGKLPALILLFIILGLIFCIIGIIPILGLIVDLILGFFLMYSVAAIVVGNEGATQAMSTSWRLARANVGPSLTAFVGIIVVAAIGSIINAIFLHMPVIGLIVSFIVGGLTAAYVALVTVRFYDLLRGSTPLAPLPPTTPTTP